MSRIMVERPPVGGSQDKSTQDWTASNLPRQYTVLAARQPRVSWPS